MPFTQQGNFTFLHSNQPDNLSSVMSAAQIKSSFDSQAQELKTTLNTLIVDLGSVSANSSGAENIGLETITGVTGTNIQTGMESLKALIDARLPSTGGTINGNLTLTGTLNGYAIRGSGDFKQAIPTIQGDGLMEVATGIDFHVSGSTIDYDARLIVGGGTGTIGAGTLTLNASALNLPTTAKLNFGSANTNIKWAESIAIECESYFRLRPPVSTDLVAFQTQRNVGANIYRSELALDSLGNTIVNNNDFTSGSTVNKNRLALNKDGITVFSSSSIKLGTDTIANDVRGTTVWTGSAFMHEGQNATPTVALDDCPNGWALKWDNNSGGASYHYTYIYKWMSKNTLTTFSMPVNLLNNSFDDVVHKGLTFTNTQIFGNAFNDDVPNNAKVLVNVIVF